MHERLIQRLDARFRAYDELARQLSEELLVRSVDVPKHKTLSDHLWCVIGARESYAKGITAGEWAGFSCSMEGLTTYDFRAKLESSSKAVRDALQPISAWDDARTDLLLSLAEHEVMHEGQIIRHMYALELKLPKSWFWA